MNLSQEKVSTLSQLELRTTSGGLSIAIGYIPGPGIVYPLPFPIDFPTTDPVRPIDIPPYKK